MADEVHDPRAPGWKHDPTGRFLGRYWDGTGWTEHVVSQDRTTSIDPVPVRPGQPAQPARPTAAAPPAPGVPLWAKVGLVAVVLAGVLFYAVRAGDDEDPPAANVDPSVVTVAPGPPSVHVLGQTVRSGDFDITVHGYRDPEEPGEFLKPAAGRHFLSVDVEVANRASRRRSFSFLLGFHLVDARDNQIDATFGDVNPPPPDGDIAPGQALRGRVLFEIPDGTSDFRFKAQGSLTEPGGLFPLR